MRVRYNEANCGVCVVECKKELGVGLEGLRVLGIEDDGNVLYLVGEEGLEEAFFVCLLNFLHFLWKNKLE